MTTELRWSEGRASMHPYYDMTRTHWQSETLISLSLSWFSLARTLGPNQRLELAGARHGAGRPRSRKAPSLLTAEACRPTG